jgi:hypothetical protein
VIHVVEKAFDIESHCAACAQRAHCVESIASKIDVCFVAPQIRLGDASVRKNYAREIVFREHFFVEFRQSCAIATVNRAISARGVADWSGFCLLNPRLSRLSKLNPRFFVVKKRKEFVCRDFVRTTGQANERFSTKRPIKVWVSFEVFFLERPSHVDPCSS